MLIICFKLSDVKLVKMENIHMCSICFEEFSDPKIIPCFHTFCRECLSKHVDRTLKNGTFHCPICRAATETPKNGADGFQSNFYINEVTNKQPNEKKREKIVISESDLKSGICRQHANEKFILYCEECKIPCCRDCKIECHDGHFSVKLVDMVNRLVPEAEKLQSIAMTKIDRAEKLESDLNAKMQLVKYENVRIKGELANRKSAIFEKMEQEAKIAETTLNDIIKVASEDIANSVAMINTARDKLMQTSVDLKQTIESNDPLLLLHAIPELRDQIDSMNTGTNVDKLFPGVIIQKSDVALDSQIELAIGKPIMKIYPSRLKRELEYVTTVDLAMKTKVYYVKTILAVSDTEAWFAIRSKKDTDKSTFMKKVSTSGNVLLSFPIKGLINTMAVFSNGKVAVSMPIENKVCIMGNDQNVYDLASVRNPMGMTSNDDDLFVCSVETREFKEIKPNSVNRIVVLSKEGLVKRAIEFFDGSTLFSFPGKISMSYRGELVVSDFAKNKVLSLGLDGQPTHEYRGQNNIVCGDVFCDNVGHILVETAEGIHVLDECLALTHTYTTGFPVDNVVAMAVGPKGMIWIGNSDNTVTIWNYAYE